ncbi:MAG: hypothetical protein HWE27_09095 [Gammaproteobacteria bacterium]|nr:hypothetical protein [Gammaproteobacteria bacterium]
MSDLSSFARRCSYISIVHFVLNVTYFPLLFSLIAEYSEFKKWLFTASNLLLFVSFVYLMLGFKRLLNEFADFQGANIHIHLYTWSNVLSFGSLGLLWLLYAQNSISGFMAILLACLVIFVVYLFVIIMTIVLGVKLAQCSNDLLGLREPIRYSFFWFGVLSLSLFFSEISFIAIWLSTLYIALLFWRVGHSQLSAAPLESFKRSHIWSCVAITIALAVGNVAYLYTIPSDGESIFEHWNWGREKVEFDFSDEEPEVPSQRVFKQMFTPVSMALSDTTMTRSIRGDDILMTSQYYLIKSNDRGETFQFNELPLKDPIVYLKHGKNNDAVAFSNSGELGYSKDNGVTWEAFDFYSLSGAQLWDDYHSFNSITFSDDLSTAHLIANCQLWQMDNNLHSWINVTPPIDIDKQCVRDYFYRDGKLTWIEVDYDDWKKKSGFWLTKDPNRNSQLFCIYYEWSAKEEEKKHKDCEKTRNVLPKEERLTEALKLKEQQRELLFNAIEEKSSFDPELLTLLETDDNHIIWDAEFNRLWLISDNLRYTDDNGQNWHTINLSINESSSQILYADDMGFAIAEAGCVIFNTKNFGETWQSNIVDFKQSCYGLDYLGEIEQTFYFWDGENLFSHKQGINQLIKSFSNEEADSSYMRSTKNLDLITHIDHNLQLSYSLDYGQTWQVLHDFKFDYVVCDLTCWATLENSLFKFDIQQTKLVADSIGSIDFDNEDSDVDEYKEYRELIWHPDDNIGWIIDQRQFWQSKDGGEHWEEIQETEDWFNDIEYDPVFSKLYLISDDLIQISQDNGLTFEKIRTASHGSKVKICSDPLKRWTLLVSEYGGLMTFNNGRTWYSDPYYSDTCYLSESLLWTDDGVFRFDE